MSSPPHTRVILVCPLACAELDLPVPAPTDPPLFIPPRLSSSRIAPSSPCSQQQRQRSRKKGSHRRCWVVSSAMAAMPPNPVKRRAAPLPARPRGLDESAAAGRPSAAAARTGTAAVAAAFRDGRPAQAHSVRSPPPPPAGSDGRIRCGRGRSLPHLTDAPATFAHPPPKHDASQAADRRLPGRYSVECPVNDWLLSRVTPCRSMQRNPEWADCAAASGHHRRPGSAACQPLCQVVAAGQSRYIQLYSMD